MDERVWFTSDTHLGHEKIIEYMNRPFSSVEEMDEVLIRRWNSVVGEQDRIYHLGDFAFKADPRAYLEKLNGRKYIVFGNHDPKNKLRQAKEDGLIEWCGDVKYLRIGRHRFWLSHYPHRVWPNSHHGSYHLYGHSHGDLPGVGRSMDVGVDCWNYFPIRYEIVLGDLVDMPLLNHHNDRRYKPKVGDGSGLENRRAKAL